MFSATLVFLLPPFISSSPFFISLSALIPIFSLFSLNYPYPLSSLMLPNPQSSSPSLLYPLSISCFVCKPQGREMGEKHSLCTTVTKDWWVIATYVPVSLLPQKTHIYRKNTQITSYLPCTYRKTRTDTHIIDCAGTHTLLETQKHVHTQTHSTAL